MSDTCAVVRIKTRLGWAELNEADFDAARHEMWSDGDAPKPEDELPAARAEYEAAVGKRPYMGWDAGTLRAKIAAHKAQEKSE